MQLDEIRKEIEETDYQIVALMKRRLELAEEVGRTKAETGTPIRNIPVEEKVIARYRDYAEDNGMSPNTAEAVCKLLMQESVERQAALPKADSAPKRIAIIGGNGKMGKWFGDLFAASGHKVDVIDPSAGNGLTAEDARFADIVIVSIPISRTGCMLENIDSIARKDALIFDVSSLKSPFIDILRNMAKRRKVCSVHPMFGPSAASMFDRNLLICDCGNEEAVEEAMELLGNRGANIRTMPVEDHDKYMAYVLGLSHAVNIAFFTVLERSGITFEDMKSVASTTYSKLMESNASVALEDPYLYYEIQHLNANREKMLTEFDTSVRDVVEAALSDNPKEFKDLMDRGREYFSKQRSLVPAVVVTSVPYAVHDYVLDLRADGIVEYPGYNAPLPCGGDHPDPTS